MFRIKFSSQPVVRPFLLLSRSKTEKHIFIILGFLIWLLTMEYALGSNLGRLLSKISIGGLQLLKIVKMSSIQMLLSKMWVVYVLDPSLLQKYSNTFRSFSSFVYLDNARMNSCNINVTETLTFRLLPVVYVGCSMRYRCTKISWQIKKKKKKLISNINVSFVCQN